MFIIQWDKRMMDKLVMASRMLESLQTQWRRIKTWVLLQIHSSFKKRKMLSIKTLVKNLLDKMALEYQMNLKKEPSLNGKTSSFRRKWWVNHKPFLRVSSISLLTKQSTKMDIRLLSQTVGKKSFSICSRHHWLIHSISLFQILWVREMIITTQLPSSWQLSGF